jgi:hypothetical protein
VDTRTYAAAFPCGNGAHSSEQLLEKARKDNDAVLKQLESRLSGLIVAEANARVKRYELNETGVPVKSPHRRSLRSGGHYLCDLVQIRN